MKKFLGLLFFALLISNIGFTESRFGELTEIRDKKINKRKGRRLSLTSSNKFIHENLDKTTSGMAKKTI